MSSSDCLFCKIIDGKIPAQITYRDEHLLMFKDINPQAPLHELAIPLRHIPSLAEAKDSDQPGDKSGDQGSDREILGRLMLAATRRAKALGYDAKGFRVVMNNGADAGQTVFHVHLHVLGGRALSWPPG